MKTNPTLSMRLLDQAGVEIRRPGKKLEHPKIQINGAHRPHCFEAIHKGETDFIETLSQ